MADEDELSSARAELRRFLIELADLLEGSLAESPELYGPYAFRLAEAWQAAKRRSDVVTRALGGERPDGKRLTQAETKELGDRLTQHGLTGEQLALKLALFRGAAADFLEELAPQAEAEAFWTTWIVRFRGSSLLDRVLRSRFVQRLEALREAGREVLRGRLKRALEAANVILDSLSQALAFLPGVGMAAGALSEFKNAAEVALGEPDEGEKGKPRRPAGEETNTAFGRLRSSLGL